MTERGSAGTHAKTELLSEDLNRNVRYLFKKRKPQALTVAIAAWNHDTSKSLGRRSNVTLKLSTNETGLRYTINPPDTTWGRDAVEIIQRGKVKIHCRLGVEICCDCGCEFDRTGVRHKRCNACKVLEHRKRNARNKARRRAHRESIGQGRNGNHKGCCTARGYAPESEKSRNV